MVAPLTHDINHFVGFVFATMSPFATLDAVNSAFVALVVFAPLVHGINHCRELMGPAMSSFATLDAVVCKFAALVVFASLANDIDHFVGFVFATMSPFAALDAVDWAFLTPVVVAPLAGHIDESVRFAMFRAMRRFSTLTTITRPLLLRATILAISHIVANTVMLCFKSCSVQGFERGFTHVDLARFPFLR